MAISFEGSLDLFHAALGLLIAVLAFSTMKRFVATANKPFRFFVVGAVILALGELADALNAFGVINYPPAFQIIETFALLSFLAAMYYAFKMRVFELGE